MSIEGVPKMNKRKGNEVLKNIKKYLQGDSCAGKWLEEFQEKEKPEEVKGLPAKFVKDNKGSELKSGGTWHDKYDNY